jgi:hypothetical protein
MFFTNSLPSYTPSLMRLVLLRVLCSCAAVKNEGESLYDSDPRCFQLPAVSSFGPWGFTAGCHKEGCEWVPINDAESKKVCQPSDRWPQGMCSLKRLADPAKPQYWSTDAGGRPLLLVVAYHTTWLFVE